MNRLALIIKGFSETEQELETDRYYVQQYYDFFLSNSGGAYEEEEIIYFEDTTSTELKDALQDVRLNYVVIILIGHGATQTNHHLFQLNENEIIKPGQINIDADKQLIILESCRGEIGEIYTVDLNDKIPKYKYGGVVRFPIKREKARELYDEQLSKCENGIVVCFACSYNEAAYNYYFSFALLQIAFNWHLEYWNHFKTFNITELMPVVSIEVNNIASESTGKSQIPQIIGNINFPIAVSKF